MKKRMPMITALFLLFGFLVGNCWSESKNNENELVVPTISQLLLSGVRTSTYLGTQNPGDVWSWSIVMTGSVGTFSATNETLSYDYSGSISILPNDFLRFQITDSTEPGMTLPAVAYGIEVVDTALIVQMQGDQHVVVCGVLGTCPTANQTLNWVPLVDSTFNLLTDTGYGVTFSTISGSDISFASSFFLMDGSPNGTELKTGFNCIDGRITKPGDTLTIALTPTGMIIGDNGPSDGGFVGMPAPASNVVLSSFLAPGREFRGFVMKARVTVDESEAVWARPNSLGGLDGASYIDMEAGIENPSVTMVNFGTQSSPGVFNATQTEGTDTTDMVIMVSRINGKYFAYGSGLTSSQSVAENFLVMEQ